MKASISFRPFRRSDFPLLQEWLSAPHVAAWWNERLDLPGVEAKYGPRVNGTEPTHMFVIEQEVRPIGWIQWYLWSDYPAHAAQLGAEPASAGIDLEIGKLSMSGLGLGPRAIRKFVRQVVFSNPEVRAVVSDPQESNLRSLRAFAKAGFNVVRTVRIADEVCRRQVVRLDRPDITNPREYELREVQTGADWTAYHRIRRTVLFEARERFGIYDENNPDDRTEGNLPLLLAFRGRSSEWFAFIAVPAIWVLSASLRLMDRLRELAMPACSCKCLQHAEWSWASVFLRSTQTVKL
jgi:RimJ/RimL family protein N-acetyltransferase